MYSFTLYLLCAYFLIILPLPDIQEVAKLTTATTQFIPFNFIIEIINHFKLSLSFLLSSYVMVPIFNILLTIPFGIYLRYYFKCSFKKTLLCTLLLSLFFELTQLSGLYGIYPRAYRLCDIDDLIQNTCGGILGYLICGGLLKFLPKIENVNAKALEKGMKVSGFKRFTSLILDLVMCFILVYIVNLFGSNIYLSLISMVLYYLIPSTIFKGQTLAQKWLNLRVVDQQNHYNFFRSVYRYFIFILIYIVIPIVLIEYVYVNLNNHDFVIEIICFLLCIVAFLFYLYKGIKFLFTSSEMFYEKISKTKLISTIKISNKQGNK